MPETFEIKKPIISIQKNDRIGFNAKLTINPSLRGARMRALPMSGEVKDFAIGTSYTTVELYGGTILTVPNSRQIAVIHQVKTDLDSLNPAQPQQRGTFKGVSIE